IEQSPGPRDTLRPTRPRTCQDTLSVAARYPATYLDATAADRAATAAAVAASDTQSMPRCSAPRWTDPPWPTIRASARVHPRPRLRQLTPVVPHQLYLISCTS